MALEWCWRSRRTKHQALYSLWTAKWHSLGRSLNRSLVFPWLSQVVWQCRVWSNLRCLKGLWLTASATSLQPVYEPALRCDASYFVHDTEHIAELFRIVHSESDVLSLLLFNPALSHVSKSGYCFHLFSIVFIRFHCYNNSIVDVVERDQGRSCFTGIPVRSGACLCWLLWALSEWPLALLWIAGWAKQLHKNKLPFGLDSGLIFHTRAMRMCFKAQDYCTTTAPCSKNPLVAPDQSEG